MAEIEKVLPVQVKSAEQMSDEELRKATEEGKGKWGIPLPKPEVFKYRETAKKFYLDPHKEVMLGTNSNWIFERVEYPEEGGILIYARGCLYPNKGFVFPQALYAVNQGKRLTRMALRLLSRDFILPALGFAVSKRSLKIKMTTRALISYRDAVTASVANYVFEERYYTPLCRELRTFITNFFVFIGIEKDVADGAAEAFVTLIEYDNAYRWRIEDVASETTKRALMSNPRREIKKLIDIYVSREKPEGEETKRTFVASLKGLRTMLLLPSFKRAFVKAVGVSYFKNFQMDAGDHYHSLIFDDYRYGGKETEERLQIFKSMHPGGKVPPRIFYTL